MGAMTPQQWQQRRRYRSNRPGDFNLPVDKFINDPDDDPGTITVRKPHPKRWRKCSDCGTRFAYEHSLDAHFREVHAPFLPPPVPASPKGPVRCHWCPAGYASETERGLHEQARHARHLAILVGA